MKLRITAFALAVLHLLISPAMAQEGPSRDEQLFRKVQELQQLRQDDPQAYQTYIDQTRNRFQEKWRHLEPERQAQFQEFARKGERRRQRLENFRRQHPQAFERMKEKRMERFQRMSERDPERFQKFLSNHPRMRERFQNRKAGTFAGRRGGEDENFRSRPGLSPGNQEGVPPRLRSRAGGPPAHPSGFEQRTRSEEEEGDGPARRPRARARRRAVR